MDSALLEYHIKRNHMNANDYCEKVGICLSAFYRKKRGIVEFTRCEIEKTADILHLSNKDIIDIFFAKNLS